MDYSRLLSFFLRRPFPRRLTLMLLDADENASVCHLRRWAADTRRESDSWFVGGLGSSYFMDRCLAAPRGLKQMPTFPFDAGGMSPRAADALVAVVSDSDCFVAPRPGENLAPGWKITSVQRGLRDAAGRNQLGFIDGSSNMLEPGERSTLHRTVVRADGGTLLVYRQIHLDVGLWGHLSTEQQEAVMGTRKADGRPLADADRMGQPSYVFDSHGARAPFSCHTRTAYPRRSIDPATLESDRNHRIFRWGYNDAERPGLLFMCMQESLERGFETVYGRWMCGEHSPTFGAGPDRLLDCGVMSTVAGAYMYMPATGMLASEEPVDRWLSEYA